MIAMHMYCNKPKHEKRSIHLSLCSTDISIDNWWHTFNASIKQTAIEVDKGKQKRGQYVVYTSYMSRVLTQRSRNCIPFDGIGGWPRRTAPYALKQLAMPMPCCTVFVLGYAWLRFRYRIED